jgi:hypothetical protein
MSGELSQAWALTIRPNWPKKWNDLARLACHGSPDIAGYFIGGGKQKLVHSGHIAARHPDTGVTEECFDGQLA